jgi:DNA polymerase III subunit delta'
MNIVGHQKIKYFLKKSLDKGVISHAYIFSGPEHLGKFGLAYEFAQKITGNDDVINPDIVVVKPEIKENKGISREGEIKIENIKELQKKLNTTSHFGNYKVGIIDPADKMNKSAQNSLLKTLEEPMDRVVIILVVRDLGKILPTIKSRCMTKNFGLVGIQEMDELVGGNEDKKDLIFWSLGRPGILKKMLEDKDELIKRQESKRELIGLMSSSVSERMNFSEKNSKDIPALLEKLGWWIVYFRNVFMENKENIPISRSKLFNLIVQTERSLETMRDTNSNARLVLENLLLEL